MRISNILWLLLLSLLAMTSCEEDDVYDAGTAETHVCINKVTFNSVEVTVEWKQGEILYPCYIDVYEAGTDKYVDYKSFDKDETLEPVKKWTCVLSDLEPGKDYYIMVKYELPEGFGNGMYPEKRIPFKTPTVDNYVDENLKGTLKVDMLKVNSMMLVVYLPEYLYTVYGSTPRIILTDKADGNQYDGTDLCVFGYNVLMVMLPVDWQSTFDVTVRGSFIYNERWDACEYWHTLHVYKESYILEDINLPLTDSVVSTTEDNYTGEERYYVMDNFKQLTEDCSLVVMKSPEDAEVSSRTVGVSVSENADGSKPVMDYSFELGSDGECNTLCVTMRGLKSGTQYYVRMKGKYDVKKNYVNPCTPQYSNWCKYTVNVDNIIPYTLDSDVKGELPVMDMVLSDYNEWSGSATLKFSSDYNIKGTKSGSLVQLHKEDGSEVSCYVCSTDYNIDERSYYYYDLSPSTKYYVSFDGLWKYEDAEHGEVLFYNLPWTTNPAYLETPAH